MCLRQEERNGCMKRILAIGGVIILVSLYVLTFAMALLSNKKAYANLFNASLYMTFIIPVLLYVYTMIYKLVHGDNRMSNLDDEIKEDSEENLNTEE